MFFELYDSIKSKNYAPKLANIFFELLPTLIVSKYAPDCFHAAGEKKQSFHGETIALYRAICFTRLAFYEYQYTKLVPRICDVYKVYYFFFAD